MKTLFFCSLLFALLNIQAQDKTPGLGDKKETITAYFNKENPDYKIIYKDTANSTFISYISPEWRESWLYCYGIDNKTNICVYLALTYHNYDMDQNDLFNAMKQKFNNLSQSTGNNTWLSDKGIATELKKFGTNGIEVISYFK